ncbi:GNAT family N-acetyltransferase [Cedecea sp. NFIX57]|uniref:GNAT family N-acetyltransferase n=1 Tax=Cedecea sp. NFIX57 TaxID=1566286 RepID=UPI000A09BB79|nr:GNAT family N-acetyltransferase [Cedecea sp. NFIX57]SMG60904.1 putative acetyltransferase [Cedecea sp. NFIX57]
MFTITPCSPSAPELQALVAELDAFQQQLYPAESNHCVELTTVAEGKIRCLLVHNQQAEAVGCGALLLQDNGEGELKRIFIKPSSRGLKLGETIVAGLEAEARQAGCDVLRLETGIHQQPAIRLYQNCRYSICEAFSPYQPDPLSIFMVKHL